MTQRQDGSDARHDNHSTTSDAISETNPEATDIPLDTTRLATPSNLLQNVDLITPEPNEDEKAPPAYIDSNRGQFRSEKAGIDTSAQVADDGRVNIRINQFNRRFSQIFTPAIREQIQNATDIREPPPPYIPPSLGGEPGQTPPPPLSVVIHVVGSRGDVQPFVALGKVLKETYRHRVRLATHPNFREFVQENGLEFFSIGGDPSQLMAFMVKNPGLMPGFRSVVGGDISQRRKDVSEYLQGCWRSCYQSGDGMNPNQDDGISRSRKQTLSAEEHAARPFVADCIIANPPSFAHIHCAEKLGVPLHIMFTMPYSPTQSFPHPLANIQSSNADPQLTNYMSYMMIEVLSWQGLGDIINRFRVRCLDLEPLSRIWAPGLLQRLEIPYTYCWSPALIPKPKDWLSHISISGFFFLNLASVYTPPPALQAFLSAGSPPVYIGFGSIVLEDPNAMTQLIFEATKKTGQRVLLSKGWGGMGADELEVPEGVFMLGNVPHDWLFKQVSCVVHHGGAGTTAAGISAGCPTVVVPFFGDQPFWGAMIARAGAGPDPIPHKQLTSDNLAEAIKFCLRPESLERAKTLASTIATEQGCEVGAQSFHQYLEVDKLRCTLDPSRAAVWRVKGTKVRLSAFAACTLANANLLDFRDLKLFRSRDYILDEGPWDPVTGGAATVFGIMSEMAMGIADYPIETWRVIRDSTKKKSAPSSSKTNAETSPLDGADGHQADLQQDLAAQATVSDTSSTFSERVSRSGLVVPFGLHSKSQRDKDDKGVMNWKDIHSNKGLRRIVRSGVTAPMEMSMSFTKGFHNLPKLWGDDSVRPQEKINDFSSGMKAMGKEFGYGMYDGISGLVTQPWRGAQKEGTSGFFKGMGKGVGGFLAKPGAALWSIPSYFMKGAWKEMEKYLNGSVSNYIVASRVAQGHEEWLQSSDDAKERVIIDWKSIQKYLKKKDNTDELLRDVLVAQRQTANITAVRTADSDARQPSYSQARPSLDTFSMDQESAVLIPTPPAITSHDAILDPRESDDFIQLSVADEIAAGNENRAQTIPRKPVNAQRSQVPNEDSAEQLGHGEQRHAVAQSSPHESNAVQAPDGPSTESIHTNRILEKARTLSSRIDMPSSHSNPDAALPPSYESSSQAGPSQPQPQPKSQQTYPSEKTAQEKTEEQIVLEYIKKQSLLEMSHRKGKTVASPSEEEEDEDLRRAMELSLREQGDGAMDGDTIGESKERDQ